MGEGAVRGEWWSWAVAAGAVAALAMSAGSAGAALPASVTDRCPNAHAQPGTIPPRALGASTVCLVNRLRASRRLPALRVNGQLTHFATSYGALLVNRRFFGHDVPGGPTFAQRARASAYARAARRHTMGENLAWATERYATPAAIVDSWMRSPGHRANILRPTFREIGVGVRTAAPEAGWEAYAPATYVHAFGSRTRR